MVFEIGKCSGGESERKDHGGLYPHSGKTDGGGGRSQRTRERLGDSRSKKGVERRVYRERL